MLLQNLPLLSFTHCFRSSLTLITYSIHHCMYQYTTYLAKGQGTSTQYTDITVNTE